MGRKRKYKGLNKTGNDRVLMNIY